MAAGFCLLFAILFSACAASNPNVAHVFNYSPSPSKMVTLRQPDSTSPWLPIVSASPFPSYSPFSSLSSYASFSRIGFANPSRSALPSPRTCSIVLQHDVPQTRIIGGTEASKGTASYMAALFLPYNQSEDPSDAYPLVFVCSAVVIARRWLLTAAHCGVTANWTVTFGGPDAQSGRRFRVAEAFAPLQDGGAIYRYNRDVSFRDVSVVRLESDAPRGVTFALVNSDPDKPYGEAFARGVGYGLTRNPSSTSEFVEEDEILHQVDAPIAQQEFCEKIYNSEEIQFSITKDMVCVGSNGCGPCFGDSGGPLIQFDSNGRPVVMGIVSAGIRCGDGERPVIYARTSQFLDWMKDEGAELNSTDDAQQLKADGTAQAPSPTPKPIVASTEVTGVNSGSVTLFAILAVVAAVAAVGLTALVWRFVHTRAQNDEVAVDISPA